MSDISPLRERVHEAFKKAFGAPDRVYGHDMHWSLRRFAYMAAVNVLEQSQPARSVYPQ
jgi:hypothetical protein